MEIEWWPGRDKQSRIFLHTLEHRLYNMQTDFECYMQNREPCQFQPDQHDGEPLSPGERVDRSFSQPDLPGQYSCLYSFPYKRRLVPDLSVESEWDSHRWKQQYAIL